MYGLKALQKTADLSYTNEVPTSVYNPSGMYGLKAMGNMCQIIPPPLPPSPESIWDSEEQVSHLQRRRWS